MPFDYAVHSNLLIHWTGRDLEPTQANDCNRNEEPEWYGKDKSHLQNHDPLVTSYLDRLRSILEFGLWMTAEKDSIEIKRGNPIKLPLVPRVCFTELRLSQSRVHAKRYGRLGIGVKHPYVFERGGRPVSYIRPPEFSQPKQDIFLQGVLERLGNESPLLHFFKSMGDIATYSFYAESEWRVIHCDEHPTVSKSEDSAQMEARTPKFKEYIEQMPNPNEARRKLRRLLPLDGWLSCIIYPSVSVKAAALNDERIRAAIKRIKEDQSCRANTVEGGNYPIEMDLDMCRNF